MIGLDHTYVFLWRRYSEMYAPKYQRVIHNIMKLPQQLHPTACNLHTT